MTSSLPHSETTLSHGGEERGCRPRGEGLRQEPDAQAACPCLWGFTLRGRWISQLHRECRDRRNGSQQGFRLFFTTLERHQRDGHLLSRFLSSALPPSFP